MNQFSPGFLGPYRGSLVSAVHADWPAYPEGNDFYDSLLRLSALPKDMNLHVIDDIDRCFLVLAAFPGQKISDPFKPSYIHLCLMYDDLLEMIERRFVEGLELVNEFEWRKHSVDQVVRSIGGSSPHWTDQAGNERRLDELYMALDPEDDDLNFLICPTGKIRLTEEARTYLYEDIQRIDLDLEELLSSKVVQLFSLGFFDTSVREACVLLESKIKNILGSKSYGMALLGELAVSLRNNQCLESSLRNYHQELKIIFKFVRNDYMHNLKEIDEKVAFLLLFRVARVLFAIK